MTTRPADECQLVIGSLAMILEVEYFFAPNRKTLVFMAAIAATALKALRSDSVLSLQADVPGWRFVVRSIGSFTQNEVERRYILLSALCTLFERSEVLYSISIETSA